jgi:hypothetical protein
LRWYGFGNRSFAEAKGGPPGGLSAPPFGGKQTGEYLQGEGKRMKVICAWCERLIRDGIEPASHGICPVCMETEIRNHGSKHGFPGQESLAKGSTNKSWLRIASEELMYLIY